MFVIQAGTAAFTVGDDEPVVTHGHVVVIPAGTPHGFEGAGDDTLRVVSVHPSGRVEQTDLSQPESSVRAHLPGVWPRLTPPEGIADAPASTHPSCVVSHAHPLGKLKRNFRLRSLVRRRAG